MNKTEFLFLIEIIEHFLLKWRVFYDENSQRYKTISLFLHSVFGIFKSYVVLKCVI